MIAPIPDIGAVGASTASLMAQLAVQMPAPMARLDVTPPADQASRTPAVGGFGTLLDRAANGLADQMATADRMQQLAATGQLSDPTPALVETAQADLALQTAIQVRNRLVEGWQELSRMSL